MEWTVQYSGVHEQDANGNLGPVIVPASKQLIDAWSWYLELNISEFVSKLERKELMCAAAGRKS